MRHQKKGIALVASDEKKSESESAGISNEDITLIAKKLGEFGTWTPINKTTPKIICFKCKGEGHVKDCPNNQRTEKKTNKFDRDSRREKKYKVKYRKLK